MNRDATTSPLSTPHHPQPPKSPGPNWGKISVVLSAFSLALTLLMTPARTWLYFWEHPELREDIADWLDDHIRPAHSVTKAFGNQPCPPGDSKEDHPSGNNGKNSRPQGKADTLPVNTDPYTPSTGAWIIQVESDLIESEAEETVRQLRAEGLNAYKMKSLVHGQIRYRVRIGGFPSKIAAGKRAARLVQEGIIIDRWITDLDVPH